MKDLLDKISSYNLFNYLLPGILFVYIAKHFTNLNLIQDNNFIGAFFYYSIGMFISCCGDLFVEPILKRIKFLEFADYDSFVAASKKDEKINLFSEINNTYRTIVAMIIILLFVKAYNHFQSLWNITDGLTNLSLIIFLLGVFLFSYRKQTNYIRKRVAANTPEKPKST